MDSSFEHTHYSTILFIDSMVALEGKPLPTLPWQEIDPTGPILILVVPQVNAEIDKRKRDGRLGRRSRDFNRLISTAAETNRPSRIADGTPPVDIAVARCGRIDWDRLVDLEPEDPDHKVVAQILNALDVPDERKQLLSHDINPIAAAARHGLKSRKLPDHWLLEPEPGPAEKEVQRLKGRVRELEATQPDLQLDLEFSTDKPLRLFKVQPLADVEQDALIGLLQRKNPPEEQRRSAFDFDLHSYDSEYDERYSTYRDSTIPGYAASLHRFLEVHYGQVPFELRVENAGHIQAENLVVRLTSKGGTLHDRFTCYPILGPAPPQPRPFRMRSILDLDSINLRERAGRHDMDFARGPDRSHIVEVHCADFRHGCNWRFEGIATIDPQAPSPFTIEAEVTAANMRGIRTRTFNLAFETEVARVGDLVAVADCNYRVPFPMSERFSAEFSAMNTDWFEFVDVDGEQVEDEGDDHHND